MDVREFSMLERIAYAVENDASLALSEAFRVAQAAESKDYMKFVRTIQKDTRLLLGEVTLESLHQSNWDALVGSVRGEGWQ